MRVNRVLCAWEQRITCNYGPCHPPCLVPIPCTARYLAECLRLRGMRGKARRSNTYANTEKLYDQRSRVLSFRGPVVSSSRVSNARNRPITQP